MRIMGSLLEWIRRPYREWLNSKSNLVSSEFADAFSMRLRAFHALHGPDEALTKKAFEYAFAEAAQAAGRNATVVRSSTVAGSDVIMDKKGISLKTEADRNIRPGHITISKLMESAWTKECATLEDFRVGIGFHIAPRLRHSSRMFTLRAFGRLSDRGAIRYELVEIPMRLLFAMERAVVTDFGLITKARGTKVQITHNGKPAFKLVFDGSDQKITIRDLDRNLCIVHGEWTLSAK